MANNLPAGHAGWGLPGLLSPARWSCEQYPQLDPVPWRIWLESTQRAAMTGLRQRLGARGEDLAEQMLEEAGMVIVDRNWRCREGEIDLVALDEVQGVSTLVFCEVKLRRGIGFGSPLEAVTATKVRRLRQTAAAWLRAHPTIGARIRIDVIGLLARPNQPVQIMHVQGVE